ncbi:hypothetical protein J6590_096110 [Homalodisca vitripennis]|nr:hypothetical protein J6590_096110 [Homalodisca vitripennis]
MTSPSSPKNLPNDLKSQLEGFNTDNMKKADTNEKIVLPTAEDVKQEKQHNQLIHSVENFKADKLKRTNTLEKIVLPNAEDNVNVWYVLKHVSGCRFGRAVHVSHT